MSPRPTRPVRRPAPEPVDPPRVPRARPRPGPAARPAVSPPVTGRQAAARSAATSGASSRPTIAPSRARVVSTASVRRFADRARRRRWATWRPLLLAASVLAVATALGWVVLASPWLEARQVQLVGGERLGLADVEALAAPDLGRPLARVDTGAIEARIEELPVVADAQVLRVWPSTLEVRVTERVPVAAVATDAGIALVDAEGVQMATAPEPPADLPLVSAATVVAGDRPLQAASEVLEQMPPGLRAQVAGTEALTPDSVTLTLRSGSTVVWGSNEDGARKAAVLTVLLQTPAEVYDVSAPGTPVTR